MKKVILSVIYLLAALMFTVNLHAMVTVTVNTPSNFDTTPGSYFNVYVMARGAPDLSSFQFKLYFAPNLINATSFVRGYQFPVAAPSEIGDDYVLVAGATYLGNPVGTSPVILATITFQILANGSDTWLVLDNTHLFNKYGGEIFTFTENGFLDLTPIGISITSVDDPSLTPGSSFTVEVWAHNVAHLWGFQFKLLFDPDILQGIEVNHSPPFYDIHNKRNNSIYTGIDNAVGYVFTDGSTYMGDHSGVTAEHVLLTKITFQVKAIGYSDLQFDGPDTILVNVFGDVILIGRDDLLIGSFENGYFSNVPLTGGEVDLVRRAAWPEQKWPHSGGDGIKQKLFARVHNFSEFTFKVKVRFIVTIPQSQGYALYELYTTEIKLKPAETKVVSVAKDFPPDKYLVIAQAFYSVNGIKWIAGNRIKRFGFPVLQ